MEHYESENRGELDRLVSQGREVQCAVKKREFSVQCAEIYSDLRGAEEVLRWKPLQKSEKKKMMMMSGKNNKTNEESRRIGYEHDIVDVDDDDWSEDEAEEGEFIRCVFFMNFIMHMLMNYLFI